MKKFIALLVCIMMLPIGSAFAADFITPQYDGAEPFSGNIAPVKIKGLYGFIDKKGTLVTDASYTAATELSDGYFKVRKNGKWGVVNSAGKEIIPCVYDESSTVISNGVWVACKGGKWGAITLEGRIAVPFVYDYLGDFTGALAPVSNGGYWSSSKNSNYRIYYGTNYGFVDREGNIKVPMQYAFAAPFKQGRARVRDANGNVFFIDETGISCSRKYTEAKDFCEGVAAVCKGAVWGYIDQNGTEVIAPAYLEAKSFSDGYAIIGNTVDNKYLEGVIDKAGNLVVGLKYDKIHSFHDGAAVFEMNDLYGFLSCDGREIMPAVLGKRPGDFSEGVALVKDSAGDRYINRYGETIEKLQNVYGESPVSGGIAIVSDSNGKYGFIKVRPGEGVRVIVNGKTVKTDTPAVIINDRTMVPLRVISESLGAAVDWDGNTKKVYITQGSEKIEMTIGSSTMTKNGQQSTLDSPPIIINDRTMVPVRFVAQSLGAAVDWDGVSASVLITK